jgi:Ca2+-binding EF-hand superfamily protein
MFEAYSTFCRLDRNEDGFITPMDFVNFFRDNGLMDCTEADCYFMLKFFDSDEDGKLGFPEYIQMLLPCTNATLRAEASQRQGFICKRGDYLSVDVE